MLCKKKKAHLDSSTNVVTVDSCIVIAGQPEPDSVSRVIDRQTKVERKLTFGDSESTVEAGEDPLPGGPPSVLSAILHTDRKCQRGVSGSAWLLCARTSRSSLVSPLMINLLFSTLTCTSSLLMPGISAKMSTSFCR